MNQKWKKYLIDNKNSPSIAGIVVCLDDEQRFLIIRRSDIDERAGMWTIPGGHIDEDDRSIEAGAARELDEETSLLVDTSDFIYLGQPKPKKHYFLTQKWSGNVKIDKPNPVTNKIEHDDWMWATINQIKEIDNTEIPIYLLEKALKIAGFDKNE